MPATRPIGAGGHPSTQAPAGPARRHQRAHPGWLDRGGVVLTGAVLTQVGVQLPTFEPEQACLLHLTSAE